MSSQNQTSVKDLAGMLLLSSPIGQKLMEQAGHSYKAAFTAVAAEAAKPMTQEEKLREFQRKQAMNKPIRLRKADIAKAEKETVVEAPAVPYFYDCTVETELFKDWFSSELAFFGTDRIAFWEQKDVRQNCWLAAVDTINSSSRKGFIKLMACTDQIKEEHKNQAFALNFVEREHFGRLVTNGRIQLRMQFWKFVWYKHNHVIPKDLAVILDLKAAVQREVSEKAHMKGLGIAEAVRAEAKQICVYNPLPLTYNLVYKFNAEPSEQLLHKFIEPESPVSYSVERPLSEWITFGLTGKVADAVLSQVIAEYHRVKKESEELVRAGQTDTVYEFKTPNSETMAAMEEARSMGEGRFSTPEELFSHLDAQAEASAGQ